jgi:hypothetical protein
MTKNGEPQTCRKLPKAELESKATALAESIARSEARARMHKPRPGTPACTNASQPREIKTIDADSALLNEDPIGNGRFEQPDANYFKLKQ